MICRPCMDVTCSSLAQGALWGRGAAVFLGLQALCAMGSFYRRAIAFRRNLCYKLAMDKLSQRRESP